MNNVQREEGRGKRNKQMKMNQVPVTVPGEKGRSTPE